MPGTIFRLPDDRALQRGITYTFLPDGRRTVVPAMSRLDVRAHAQSHDENEHSDIVQALQDILQGRKPVPGRALNRRGVAHGGRINPDNRDIRGPEARAQMRRGIA